MLVSAFELLKPWPLKIVIDSVLGQPSPRRSDGPPGGRRREPLLAACAAFVVIHAAIGALAVLSNYTTIGIGQRMVAALRGDLYAHLHRLSLGFHSRARVGDLLYRVTADTLALQTLTMNCLFPAVTALVTLAGMGAIMLALDWKLTLLSLGVCPLLLLVIARLDSRVTRAAGAVRERESEVYALVQRSMSAMRVIQAFTREDDEQRRFMAASGRSLAAGRRLYTLQSVVLERGRRADRARHRGGGVGGRATRDGRLAQPRVPGGLHLVSRLALWPALQHVPHLGARPGIAGRGRARLRGARPRARRCPTAAASFPPRARGARWCGRTSPSAMFRDASCSTG